MKEEIMETYTVFGNAIVEISMEIEAENKEEAIKKLNEQNLFINSFFGSARLYADSSIEWNYAEKTGTGK